MITKEEIISSLTEQIKLEHKRLEEKTKEIASISNGIQMMMRLKDNLWKVPKDDDKKNVEKNMTSDNLGNLGLELKKLNDSFDTDTDTASRQEQWLSRLTHILNQLDGKKGASV